MDGNSTCKWMCVGNRGGVGEVGMSGVCGGSTFGLGVLIGTLGVSVGGVQLLRKPEEKGC